MSSSYSTCYHGLQNVISSALPLRHDHRSLFVKKQCHSLQLLVKPFVVVASVVLVLVVVIALPSDGRASRQDKFLGAEPDEAIGSAQAGQGPGRWQIDIDFVHRERRYRVAIEHTM